MPATKEEILEAIRAAVAAKTTYWDRMNELEAALDREDPPDRLSDYLVTYIDDLAANVNASGDVSWIKDDIVDDVLAEVAEYPKEECDE